MGKHIDQHMHRIVCQILVASPSVADQNRIRRRKSSDPSAKSVADSKSCYYFPRNSPLSANSNWQAEGGSRGEKKLDSCVLLALRHFPRLAGRGRAEQVCRVCVKLAGAA